MGFLRTKEDPKVNEQKNRERNLASATDEQGVYTMMSYAYIIARGENQKKIKEKLNENPTFRAMKKQAKEYSREKSYGSKKKDYYLMDPKEKTKTQKSILLTLTRFIGISLFKFNKDLDDSIRKLFLDENDNNSLVSNIITKKDLKTISDKLKKYIIERPELKEKSDLFEDIKTHVLDKFSNFPDFASEYDKLVKRIEEYYKDNLKNSLNNAEFSNLSSEKCLFNGIASNGSIWRLPN